MPLSLEEYGIAQMYMVTKMQQKNTTGTEGVELLESRPFEDDVYGKGRYTPKVYRLQSKVPAWLRKFAPPHALDVQEEAWSAYPRCKSVLKVHGLSKEQLAARIHRLLTSFNIREFFVLDRCDPVMTAYKLVTIDAPYWGFGRRLEQALLAGERALFLESHRHCFGWIDEWYGMTVQQIDELLQPNDSTLNERIVKPALMMSIEYFSGESPPDGEGIYSKKSQSVS
ncbi:hypothetical protein I3760_13G104600 [Carya illinoinensis]|uniref:phosphatidylinositol transfer protein 1-like isoform X14 n=1 Tax=Carya illinoinensis TaxID=32201 RepID=UPI001BF1F035|nr:phosphatidylinositol transfer protein 1-like isoform X14 [Carya illinoinensis]KAG2673736.1 hypothetical protein I3760_13G104600 [Carya illinoinensis]